MHQSDKIKIGIICLFKPTTCSVINESWEFTFPTMDGVSMIDPSSCLDICAFCLSSMATFPPPTQFPLFSPQHSYFVSVLILIPLYSRCTPCLLWVAISIFQKCSFRGENCFCGERKCEKHPNNKQNLLMLREKI